MPIWKPFIAWIADCALVWLSKLTNPVHRRNRIYRSKNETKLEQKRFRNGFETVWFQFHFVERTAVGRSDCMRPWFELSHAPCCGGSPLIPFAGFRWGEGKGRKKEGGEGKRRDEGRPYQVRNKVTPMHRPIWQCPHAVINRTLQHQSCSTTRGRPHKLFKHFCAKPARSNFFSERDLNECNALRVDQADFGSVAESKRSLRSTVISSILHWHKFVPPSSPSRSMYPLHFMCFISENKCIMLPCWSLPSLTRCSCVAVFRTFLRLIKCRWW